MKLNWNFLGGTGGGGGGVAKQKNPWWWEYGFFLELCNNWVTYTKVRILVTTFIMFNQNLRQASSYIGEQ